MKDTQPDIECEYNRRLMSLTPAERLRMACDMFTTAKTLARAGIRAQYGDLPDDEIEHHILWRFYGDDLRRNPALARMIEERTGRGPV